MNRLQQNLRMFTGLSVVIGLGLGALHWFGLFDRFDLAVLAAGAGPRTFAPVDGLLVILLFAILPGIGMITWRMQATIVCTILGWGLYGWVVWAYWHVSGVRLPIAAPVLAGIASLGRGIGYNLKIDVQWAQQYGCFVSYRRGQGAEIARLVAGELKHRGIPTFLDVEGLGASHFDDQLLRHIEANPNFIVILTAGALDRCKEPGDWLAKEISCAVANRKNIIPVMGPRFDFPARADMPDFMAELSRHQAVTYSHDFFSAMMGKLVEFLKSRKPGGP